MDIKDSPKLLNTRLLTDPLNISELKYVICGYFNENADKEKQQVENDNKFTF
jgi:hypothetical protein